jgi:hypothetical protein
LEPNHCKGALAIVIITLIILTVIIGVLINQNANLTNTNAELLEENHELSTLHDESIELISKLENTTFELEAIRENYTRLLDFFNHDSDPKIQTRLGGTLIEPYQNKDDNYVWITGVVENKENVTVYDVRLKITLFTNQGVDIHEDLIGTMQPHQVIDRRFAVLTSAGKITNWSIEPLATFVPT